MCASLRLLVTKKKKKKRDAASHPHHNVWRGVKILFIPVVAKQLQGHRGKKLVLTVLKLAVFF